MVEEGLDEDKQNCHRPIERPPKFIDGHKDPKFDNTTPALAGTKALQAHNRELKKGENYKTKRIDLPIIESDDEDPTPFHGRRMSFTHFPRPTAIDLEEMTKDDRSENAA